MKRTLFLSILIVPFVLVCSICGLPSIGISSDIPKYKIVWSDGTTYGILFQQKLTDNDFEKIIFEFREIRKRNEFNKYFPPPKNYKRNDPYGVLQFTFFTDPKWSSRKMSERFVNNKMTKLECQNYYDNIRGYYGWSRNPFYEKGSIGDFESNNIKSKNYRELFKEGGI